MRVEVNPRTAVSAPGKPSVFTIQVFNTEPLISGHRIRVLGADTEWTSLDKEQLSLFPDATGVAVLAVTFPSGSPAGTRRITVEVSEITEPYSVQVVDLDLEVPPAPALTIKLDPVSTNAGRHGSLTAIVSNTGNVTQAGGVDRAATMKLRSLFPLRRRKCRWCRGRAGPSTSVSRRDAR